MMLAILLIAAASLSLLLPYLTERYLRRLPDAPLCPGCRRLTRGDRPGLAALLLPALGLTVLRECAACGWRGRMRLRWAGQGAPRG